jgi:hypothetical protein
VEHVPGVHEADREPDRIFFVREDHWTFTSGSV